LELEERATARLADTHDTGETPEASANREERRLLTLELGQEGGSLAAEVDMSNQRLNVSQVTATDAEIIEPFGRYT